MSCYSGNCGCGSGCKCGNGCGGCGMYPDVEKATIIDGIGAAPKKMFSEMSIAAEGGHGHGHGCKCGPNCNCNPCNC